MAYQENLQNSYNLFLTTIIPVGNSSLAKGNLLRDGSDITLIANSMMVANALKSQMLEKHPQELQHQ